MYQRPIVAPTGMGLRPMEFRIMVDKSVEYETILDLVPAARGRKAISQEMYQVRALGQGDVEHILNPPKLGVQTPTLAKIRHQHHTLARLLADGLPAVEVSAITGTCQSRISILKHDPAFQELLAYYAEQKRGIYVDVHQRLAALGLTAVEELQERLDNDPGSMKTREVLEIANSALDRSTAPSKVPIQPQGTTLNINFVSPQDTKTIDGKAE